MFIFIMSIFGSGVITSHDQYIVITKWDDPMYMTDFKRSLTLASTVMYSMYEPKQFDLITNKTLFYLLTFYYALTIILMSTNSHKNTCIQRRVKKFIDNIIKTLTSNLVCMTRFWNIKFGWSIINIYILPDHLSSLPVLVGFVLLGLQFYVYVLQIIVCPFVLLFLTMVLSVLLRFTDSDYPFGIFKLFLWWWRAIFLHVSVELREMEH